MTPARSVILDMGLRVVLHTVLVFSVFLLLRGHDAPGGGFSGGLVAATGLVLVWSVRGRALPVGRASPETLLGLGIVVAGGTGAVAWGLGGSFLEHGKVVLDLPIFGALPLFSALAFDIGVYLVVVGVVALLLDELGAGPGVDGPTGTSSDPEAAG